MKIAALSLFAYSLLVVLPSASAGVATDDEDAERRRRVATDDEDAERRAEAATDDEDAERRRRLATDDEDAERRAEAATDDVEADRRRLRGGGDGGEVERRAGAPGIALTLAVFGDWPYSQALLDRKMLLIDSVNGDPDVSIVAHVGDIHSGRMPCTGAGYKGSATVVDTSIVPAGSTPPVVNPGWNTHIYNAFQKFIKPVIYTPGDNEWADCHKTNQFTSGAPLAELNNLRELFFSVPGRALGRTGKDVMSQAVYGTSDEDRKYVENVMWQENLVTFATFNIPGGSNDDSDPWTGVFSNIAAQTQERLEREAANLRWLDAAFNAADSSNSKAVVIMLQADMFDPEKGAGSLTNYAPFVQKLAERSLAFSRPVLLLNGDSHVYKADKPLVSNGATGPYTKGCDLTVPPTCDLSKILSITTPPVPNLSRVTVKGSDQPGGLAWLKLTINPTANNPSNVFEFKNVCFDSCP